MINIIKYFILLTIMSIFVSNVSANYDKLAYDFSFNDLEGSELKLSDFKNNDMVENLLYTALRVVYSASSLL